MTRPTAWLCIGIGVVVTVHAAYHLPPDKPKPASTAPAVSCPVANVHPVRWVM